MRISPHYATVDALKAAGHQSAQSVYFQGRDAFVQAMTEPFGSAPLAKMAYARAQMAYATALMAYSRYNAAFNGLTLAAMGPAAPDTGTLANLPDLQALFGSLDYFQCDDCQSVYSPAAYLVDLLQYLSWFSATGGGVTNARDALLQRRPDIECVALDCSNTNTTLPYIDLVNEILEAAIAPPASPVTIIDTTGTSAERRALPQQISQPAYAATAQAVFPLSLPFDLAFAQTQAYIAALGTTRAAVLALFAGNPVAASAAPAIAGASLGINPGMQAVINGTDPHQDWERWGLPQYPPSVLDPVTREPYAPNPADWVAALSKVPVLLNRTGLTLQQLYQLLEVVWVTQSGVTLQAGTTTVAGLRRAQPGHRRHDIYRSYRRCPRPRQPFSPAVDGLGPADVGTRLGPGSGRRRAGGGLTDAFLVFLSGAIAVQNRLGLPFQEVLSFWMPLETRDVTNHLGDEDTVTPSTYTEVFRNPAVLASAGGIFVPLSQAAITGASDASPIAITTAQPHGYQTGQQVSIAGVLGNTAANGTFTITVVTSPTSFTLTGSAGNGTWTSGGTATGLLSGNPITAAGSGPPTPEQNAITASLGLSADDVSAILAFTGAAPALSLPTLNVLLRYQRLASALSLDVPDLILWIQLTDGQPFGVERPLTRWSSAAGSRSCREPGLPCTTWTTCCAASRRARVPSPSPRRRRQSSSRPSGTRSPSCPPPRSSPSPAPPTPHRSPSRRRLLTGCRPARRFPSPACSATPPRTARSPSRSRARRPSPSTAPAGTGTGPAAAASPSMPTTRPPSRRSSWRRSRPRRPPRRTSSPRCCSGPASCRSIPPPSACSSPRPPGSTRPSFRRWSARSPTVAKAAALFTALNPTETAFAFAVQAAAPFGWLDPSALPLAPVTASPYTQFEALLTAFRLDQRQSARTPKLFDILAQWLPPGSLPPDVTTAIAGPTLTITGASDGTPIAVDTATPHGLQTGEQVTISGVLGNTAANGTFTVTVTGPASFTLDGSAGNGTWTSGGTVSQPALAFALNASVDDVLALASALGATAPGLTPGSRPGSLADMAMLAAIASALDVAARYSMSGATLWQLAATPATADTASAAMAALQAQYAQSAWFGAIQPVEDKLRETRRDALVAYLLGPGPGAGVPPMLTTDDIYNYYLIDPEMSSCALMTRLLQASLAVQQFVQQCFLNLTIAGVTVDTSDPRWSEWSWRQQYRLWQAAREVFLYPENYVLPELRTDASPFFTDLESDLRQSNCDEDRGRSGHAELPAEAGRGGPPAGGRPLQRDPRGRHVRPARLRAHQRHSGPVVLPHPHRVHPGRGQLERMAVAQPRHRIPASAAGDLGPAAPPDLAGLQADLGETKRPARPGQRRRKHPEPGAAEILVRGVRDEPAQRGPVAAQADPDPEAVLEHRRLAAGIHLPRRQDWQFNLQLQTYFVAVEEAIAKPWRQPN